MKKSPKKILRHPKLVMRGEAIALLTPPQLDIVIGGGSWPVCTEPTLTITIAN
jgi:hypothetical protein